MSLEAWGDEPHEETWADRAAEAGWIDPTDVSQAMLSVMIERDRQWDHEGFRHDHDDGHTNSELAKAAGCYLLFADAYPNAGQPPPLWPWAPEWWKPKDYRRDLVRAAALTVAEIERFDRRAERVP